jgi:uncharacterized protein involved in exopolysaccharide biosynthesis
VKLHFEESILEMDALAARQTDSGSANQHWRVRLSGWAGVSRGLRHPLVRLAVAAAAGGALGLVAAVAMGNWYESSAQIAVVPVEDPTQPGNPVEGAVAASLLSALLQSGPAADATMETLGLGEVYRTRSKAEGRSAFWSHVSVSSDRRSSIVRISAEDRDPVRARDIAAALTSYGVRRMGELWSGGLRSHREQLEARLDEVSKKLARAELEMGEFRERTGIVDFEEQRRASVAQAAALEKVRIEKNMVVRFAQKFGTGNSPEVTRGRSESKSAEQELASLEYGNRHGLLPSLGALPALEIEHARLKRAIDTGAASQDMLLRQIEQLRSAEGRSLARVDVIEEPIESHTRSRPNRAALVALGGLLAAALVWVLDRLRSGARPAAGEIVPTHG